MMSYDAPIDYDIHQVKKFRVWYPEEFDVEEGYDDYTVEEAKEYVFKRYKSKGITVDKDDDAMLLWDFCAMHFPEFIYE